MKIIRVVLNLGESKMFVLCEHRGLRRNVKVEWKVKMQSDIPPKNWPSLVEYEMDDVFSNLNAPKGRKLPF